MKKLKPGTALALSILFFVGAVLEAVFTQNWLWVTFWTVLGILFLWTDLRESRKNGSENLPKIS